MPEQQSFTRARLRTPRAAAIAGILFSILLGLIFGLLRISLPADPLDTGEWLATSTRTVGLAINLVPFAGVAFLWFIGVLRDRLGAEEDRFFATVFLHAIRRCRVARLDCHRFRERPRRCRELGQLPFCPRSRL